MEWDPPTPVHPHLRPLHPLWLSLHPSLGRLLSSFLPGKNDDPEASSFFGRESHKGCRGMSQSLIPSRDILENEKVPPHKRATTPQKPETLLTPDGLRIASSPPVGRTGSGGAAACHSTVIGWSLFSFWPSNPIKIEEKIRKPILK